MKLKKPTMRKPAMKKPELKVPPVVADFYYDLRDRRLLLPIALVVVAIAAVPVLLGDSEPVAPPPVALDPGPPASPASASLAVVEATPGLRDYRKRLHARTPTDPFEQRHTSLPEDAQVESTSVTSSTGGGSGEVATVDVEGGAEEPTTPPDSGGSGSGSAQRYELVVDVQIARSETKPDGSEEQGELEIRRNVPVLTQLPGKKTPVVTTMGANFSKETLVFLVSHEVKAIRGEFACITRAEVCELLEVKQGMLLEFVYEPSGALYTLKVTGVDAIPVRKGRDARSSRVAVTKSYPGLALGIP
jgi:hypothetical protein